MHVPPLLKAFFLFNTIIFIWQDKKQHFELYNIVIFYYILTHQCMLKIISNDGWSDLHFKILFLSSAVIFQIIFFKYFSGITSECQAVWIQVGPDILGLVWIETVLQNLSADSKY